MIEYVREVGPIRNHEVHIDFADAHVLRERRPHGVPSVRVRQNLTQILCSTPRLTKFYCFNLLMRAYLRAPRSV